MSSIVLACRKIHEDKEAYFEDILPEIEDKVKNMLKHLTVEDLIDLPMTDLLIMTYGKVLEETTQHTILKSYRADFKPEFENLIKDAREYILKEIVTKLTGRSPNVLGSDMSFYMITKAFYRGFLDSNEARKVAWAYSIDLEDLDNNWLAIHPNFHKLIVALRTAVATDGLLEKSQSAHNEHLGRLTSSLCLYK